MDKILVGQAHSTRIITRTDKEYLVVGIPSEDKLLCRDLDTRDYCNVPRSEVEHIRTEGPKLPIVAQIL